MKSKQEDYVFKIKCQIISEAITPILPEEILFQTVSHENGITLKRIQCVVYAILSWYEGTFTLKETIEILKWYLSEKLVLSVISRISEDIENVLKAAEPSRN